MLHQQQTSWHKDNLLLLTDKECDLHKMYIDETTNIIPCHDMKKTCMSELACQTLDKN